MTGAARVALRLASRSLSAARGRTAGTVLALAVPLSAVLAVATATASATPPVDALVGEQMGTAQALMIRVAFEADDRVVEALEQGPPAGVAAAPEVSGSVNVRGEGHEVVSRVYGMDLTADMHQGRFEVRKGRPARDHGEVALSDAVARRLGVSPGGVVEVGSERRSLLVVGTLVRRSNLDSRIIQVTPRDAAEILDADRTASDEAVPSMTADVSQLGWFTEGLPATTPEMTEGGWTIEARAEVHDHVLEDSGSSSEPLELAGSLAGFSLLLVGLIVWAVYKLVASSRRRELALLDAAGVPPRTQRQILVFEGLLTGVVAAGLVIAIGVAVGAAASPIAASAANRQVFRVDVPWLTLGICALVAVVLPGLIARLALDATSDAESGVEPHADRSEGPARLWIRRLTVVFLLLGAGLAFFSGATIGAPSFAAIGSVMVLVGAVVVMSPYVAKVATLIPSSDLAAAAGSRMLARVPGRAMALATVIASLTLATGTLVVGGFGLAAHATATYVPLVPTGATLIQATRSPTPSTVEQVGDDLGGRPVVYFRVVAPPPPSHGPALDYWGEYQVSVPDEACGTAHLVDACRRGGGSIGLVRPSELGHVLGRASTSDELGTLERGEAIVLDPNVVEDGQIALTAPDWSTRGRETTLERRLKATVVDLGSGSRGMPAALVGPGALPVLDATVNDSVTILYSPPGSAPPTVDQEDAARATLSADVGTGYLMLDVERGSQARATIIRLVAYTMLLLLAVVVIVTWLAVRLLRHDIERDVSALKASGVPPRFVQRLVAWHGTTLAGIGVALAVAVLVVSAVPTLVSVGAMPDLSVVFYLAALVCAVPAIACAIAFAVGSGSGR